MTKRKEPISVSDIMDFISQFKNIDRDEIEKRFVLASSLGKKSYLPESNVKIIKAITQFNRRLKTKSEIATR